LIVFLILFSKVLYVETYLTINVSLILKVREVIFFFVGKAYNGAFRGIFLRGSKKSKIIEKSQETPHYMFCPRQKNKLTHCKNQKYIGIFMSLSTVYIWYMFIHIRSIYIRPYINLKVQAIIVLCKLPESKFKIHELYCVRLHFLTAAKLKAAR
jgi:hypothetical protein